jgi:hypothetical protein
MIVVIRQGSVDLGQGKVRILKVHLFGARPVREFVHDHFNDFDVGLVNPGHASFIEPDVCCCFDRHTGCTLPLLQALCKLRMLCKFDPEQQSYTINQFLYGRWIKPSETLGACRAQRRGRAASLAASPGLESRRLCASQMGLARSQTGVGNGATSRSSCLKCETAAVLPVSAISSKPIPRAFDAPSDQRHPDVVIAKMQELQRLLDHRLSPKKQERNVLPWKLLSLSCLKYLPHVQTFTGGRLLDFRYLNLKSSLKL